MPDTILIDDNQGIRAITLNRPERRNALTPEMQNELIEALDDAASTPGTRLLILKGAGGHFCAGLDLSALQAMASKSAFELQDDAHRISRMFRTLFELPIPTIALVSGYALAGGTGLATFCDFTFATPDAKFGYTEAKIGFVPALVSAYLGLQVGDKRARDLLLTGRVFNAEEALSLGLISDVVPAEAMSTHLNALLGTLMANSPTSLRATKNLLSAQHRAWLDQALDLSMQANAVSAPDPRFQRGGRCVP